jgi:predicted DNA-binding transcriptional regulator AlpA
MCSNLALKKVCQYCGKVFIAKKTNTKFCSSVCADRNKVLLKRIEEFGDDIVDPRKRPVQSVISQPTITLFPIEQRVLIDIKLLALATGMSERTLFRLIKDPDFPKIKIGKRLLFDKKVVIEYLVKKYGNW